MRAPNVVVTMSATTTNASQRFIELRLGGVRPPSNV
jgi:hypothetical protein